MGQDSHQEPGSDPAGAKRAALGGRIRQLARRALNVPGGRQYDDEVRWLHERLDAQDREVRGLSGDLTALRAEFGSTRAELASARDDLDLARREFRSSADQFADVVASFAATRQPAPTVESARLAARLQQLEAAVADLTDLSERMAVVESLLFGIGARLDELSGSGQLRADSD